MRQTHVRKIDLGLLTTLQALIEERSITRAAERLWIAQPGLSTQVRRLEAELSLQLLDRHPRGVELTPAGEVFLERARAALDAAEAARSTGTDLEAGLAGKVRLGIATEAPAGLARPLLDTFGQERPDVEVTVLESYSGTLMRGLRAGDLDAVIAAAAFGSAEQRSLPVGSEPWVVLVGPGHRLAFPGPVAAGDLHAEPVVVTGHRDAAWHDRAVAELLTGLGVTPLLQRGGPGPALYAAVAAGDAVALTTAAAARGELIARPLEPARHLRFALLWCDRTPAPALAALIRAVAAGVAPAPVVRRALLASVA
jgi:DNA-binding transcriptional LysR family regulator